MRYFIKLAYNGLPFHGWQRQPNGISVQQTIEEALQIITRRQIAITGAGRTDTGVSAREMYAHFDLSEEIGNLPNFARSLDRLCGSFITIEDIIPVDADCHTRFDATARTYKYFVYFKENPFTGTLAWRSPASLDVELMNKAADILLQTDDFTSFAKLHSDAKTNICHVTRAKWEEIRIDLGEGSITGGIVFTITADRFLRNMVRAIVGTLVDVGRHKISITDFKRIIDKKDRCAAGTSMPPGALYLWKVEYPFLNNG